jgi:hypothetical protein
MLVGDRTEGMRVLLTIRRRPSHSSYDICGRGFLGSMRTTFDSTCGGGLKLFLPTCGVPNQCTSHMRFVHSSYLHDMGNLSPHLDVHRQSRVQLLAWLCEQTHGELALKHEYTTPWRVWQRQELED